MTNRDRRDDTPFRLNLEQQKKRAKELLKALNAGDPDAQARFRLHHPKAEGSESIARDLGHLADAQLVIARELGTQSWPTLKAHIVAMNTSRSAMEAGASPLDTDQSTLHIRCGSDLKEALKAAGFTGDFLEYSDPLGIGPVSNSPDLVSIRSRFLTEAFGRWMEFSEADAIARHQREELDLAAAVDSYQRVVLWFEHDSFDQLILARVLAHFAASRAPATLELVAVNSFPGSSRFIGLGQLPPEALRLLWESRQTVSHAQLDEGTQVWCALQSGDPTPLAGLARSRSLALPHMAGALERHLRELPSTFNGLGLTEQLIVEEVAGEPLPAGRIFRNLMMDKDPLPWLGDLMFLFILEQMMATDDAVLSIDPSTVDEDWPRRRISLTPIGRNVLAGKIDFLSLNPPERWIGGVCIRPGQPNWRWDADAGKLVRN